MAVLTPVLTGGNGTPTYNLGMAETYSWIPIKNDQNRPMYARAGYITNFSDLTISLSAATLNIGNVKIQDGNSAAVADVVQAGVNYALLVQTQDLDSVHDSITIADRNGHFADCNGPLSALYVYAANDVAVHASQTFPISGSVTVLNPVTNWDVLSAAINSSSYTTLPSNPANEITILNNTGGIMYIKNASKTIGLPIDNNTSADLKLVGNTNEVAVMASSNNKTVYATFIAYN